MLIHMHESHQNLVEIAVSYSFCTHQFLVFDWKCIFSNTTNKPTFAVGIV